jgi:hypothetical protein
MRHSVAATLAARGFDIKLFGTGAAMPMGSVLQAVAGFRLHSSIGRVLHVPADDVLRFHIVIENIRRDYYFSEKLVTALAAGCVPIYWGCPSIAHFFDSEGMTAVACERIVVVLH